MCYFVFGEIVGFNVLWMFMKLVFIYCCELVGCILFVLVVCEKYFFLRRGFYFGR